LPLILAVFIGFLIIGLALPVLPLQVHQTLGLSTFVVGAVAGCQFIAALLSRAWAGGLADLRGAKTATMIGCLIATLSGFAYLLSIGFDATPSAAAAILMLGRASLGCAESLLVTGALAWGVGLAGGQHAGKVMAWIGIAIYGAYAAGAPLCMALYQIQGFAGIALATIGLPLVALAVLASQRAIAPTAQRRVAFYKVLQAVWLPGLGLAMSSIGFGVITTFASLLFAARGWGNASLAFTAFGFAFIAARLFFGHLPDRIGGAKVALICVLIEAAGQMLIWGAVTPGSALAGAALTGFGYSLAFPGFGVEAVRRAPAQSRGAAMGAYVAFLDIALAIAAPAAGAIATSWTIGTVYLVSAVIVATSALVALRLSGRPSATLSRQS